MSKWQKITRVTSKNKDIVELCEQYFNYEGPHVQRFCQRINQQWDQLTMAEKKECTQILAERGFVDEKIIKLFGGVIVRFPYGKFEPRSKKRAR